MNDVTHLLPAEYDIHSSLEMSLLLLILRVYHPNWPKSNINYNFRGTLLSCRIVNTNLLEIQINVFKLEPLFSNDLC